VTSMADLTVDVPLDAVCAIEAMFRDNGRFPTINETVAQEGYPNVMIGVAPVGLFGPTITFRGMPGIPFDCEECRQFWTDIVNIPSKVAAELHDYHVLLANVSKVYYHVTGGVISKPNTTSEAVIATADEYYNGQLGDQDE